MKTFFIFVFISNFLLAQLPAIKTNGNASVEIGNHFIGIEAHHNFPMLQRISFFYPSANSIDLSTDYWKRDSSFCMAASITVDGKMDIINMDKYDLFLTPYSADYIKKDPGLTVNISYRFCKDEPAIVNTYSIQNTGSAPKNITLHTHLETSIKTSHSYKLKDSASVYAAEEGSSLVTQYYDPETQFAEIFIANAGEKPKYKYNESVFAKEQYRWWENTNNDPPSPQTGSIAKPAAGYLYEKSIAPGESLEVVHIIGSSRNGESGKIITELISNYKEKVDDYESFIAEEIERNNIITGDTSIDKTTKWAKAILEVNRHFIDSTIQPMPCPAEYNFYFTHDVLLTDLAVVNYDIGRVKDDLSFIVDHADKSKIIPHAYYWRDTAFVTEYATPDNWNHFWFILLSASYLRHSNDVLFLEKIYPHLTKSLEQAMQNRVNNLMYAYRPDWWDIGRNYGPRTFMTTLAIKALREYVYISSMLGKNKTALRDYAQSADKLQLSMNEKLWSNEQNYLINYFENKEPDKHYYIGSLLAAVYNFIDQERKIKLTESAKKNLLDDKIGIYTVYPMDFHELIGFLKFAGDEAGQPYKYINGGVWPHGNAWYALALMSAGRGDEAFDFIKRIMTIDGVMNSPNGEPAMYEYRVSNSNDSTQYGKIDKPQFMWAAGWYIYCLYHLLAIDESEWNIKFNPYMNEQLSKTELPLFLHGEKFNISISGTGSSIKQIRLGNKELNSYILPESERSGDISIVLGEPDKPFLIQADARVITCAYTKETMRIKLSAYKGKQDEVIIFSPNKPEEIRINDKQIEEYIYKEKYIHISLTHSDTPDLITIYF